MREVRRGGVGNRKRYSVHFGSELGSGLNSSLPPTASGTQIITPVSPRPPLQFTCSPSSLPRSRRRGGRARDEAGPRAADLCPLLPAAYLVQAVRAAGKCDAVFKGFSDCLLKLGDSMANYPQGLDDKTNIKTVCT